MHSQSDDAMLNESAECGQPLENVKGEAQHRIQQWLPTLTKSFMIKTGRTLLLLTMMTDFVQEESQRSTTN